MSSYNFKPGISKVDVKIIEKVETEQYYTDLQFELNGLHRLKSPDKLGGEYRHFHIYVFLVYYEGGKDFEIVTSAQHYTRLGNGDETAAFRTKFRLPQEHPYLSEDFVLNYYTVEVCYTESPAEDASDINMMLGNNANTLFSTKLDFKGNDIGYE